MKICLCFGGPSDERNISAGSLKPWVSWLGGASEVQLEVVYFDRRRQGWRLPERYRYTNTCEDFESQLGPDELLSEEALDALLGQQDVVVPLIHGEFGEDGELQTRLEELGVAYVFSGPAALALTMDKQACYGALAAAGLPIPRHLSISRSEWQAEPEASLERARSLIGPGEGDHLCLAVKPLRGGSSLGVTLSSAAPDSLSVAIERALEHDDVVLFEALLEGTEFSIIVLETDGGPVALAPTEVEKQGRLYDTRSKYLHGEGARLHTPMRDGAVLSQLRAAALAAWGATGLRDMARVDGFLQPDGQVVVTDVNGISGMGFSSFGFLQTSMCGISHADLIEHLLARAATRAGQEQLPRLLCERDPARRVHVIFGGPTSERQVSRQSGIFVGLSLLSRGYDVRFILMDLGCRFTEVGLFHALHHDVEEIQALVESPARRREIEQQAELIGAELGLPQGERIRHLHVGPTTELERAVAAADFVFLGLHGGPGEDGRLQGALEALGKPYNGCGPHASHLCSDKELAVLRVESAALPGVSTPRQRVIRLVELSDWLREGAWEERFRELCAQLGSSQVIFKPAADGCSTGVKLLSEPEQLAAMAHAIVTLCPELPAGALGAGSRPLKLPVPPPERWVFERALVDEEAPPLPAGDLNAENLSSWLETRRFLEITCALITHPDTGQLRAAIPSLTVAASGELSLEEKFQQGMGTNLELDAFLGSAQVDSIRARVEAIAHELGIEGYARIDCFLDQETDCLYLLEPNTLCGLTEATVFYSQASSTFELSPPEALEWLVRAGQQRAAAQALEPQASGSTRTAMTSIPAR